MKNAADEEEGKKKKKRNKYGFVLYPSKKATLSSPPGWSSKNLVTSYTYYMANFD